MKRSSTCGTRRIALCFVLIVTAVTAYGCGGTKSASSSPSDAKSLLGRDWMRIALKAHMSLAAEKQRGGDADRIEMLANQARRAYEEASRDSETRVDALFASGQLERLLGDTAAAMERWERVVGDSEARHSLAHLSALKSMGDVSRAEGEISAAKKYYRAIIEEFGSDSPAAPLVETTVGTARRLLGEGEPGS